MLGAAAHTSTPYRPRQPVENVVTEVVRAGLPELIEQATLRDASLPAFITGEFEALLGCGDPTVGFTHLACPRCGTQRVLAFSCKCRTICSSCAGRRMHTTTAFLVDHVIADVPVRHWTLTFPPPLRYLLAYDTGLCTRLLNVFIGVIFQWQRRIAKRELTLKSVRDISPAAITAIHRVGSAINLNLHFHSVVTDGVFVRVTPGERPVFRALPAPTKTDVTALALEVCQKTTRILRKLGRDDDSDAGDADVLARDQPLLAQCYAASLQGFVALGARVGQRVQRRGQFTEHGSDSDSDVSDARFRSQVHRLGHGFNLHAGQRVSASDTTGRARLLRYMVRPPIATKRLTRSADGRVTYWLKEAWSDGSTCVTFEPLDFLAKLVPLIPPPRANLTRYHGAWAPNAKIRPLVVPRSSSAVQLRLPLEHKKAAQCPQSRRGHHSRRPDTISWSELAKRTFAVDVKQCATCGHSPICVVAVVAAPTQEHRALLEGAVSATPLRIERSRAPPRGHQMRFTFTRAAAA